MLDLRPIACGVFVTVAGILCATALELYVLWIFDVGFMITNEFEMMVTLLIDVLHLSAFRAFLITSEWRSFRDWEKIPDCDLIIFWSVVGCVLSIPDFLTTVSDGKFLFNSTNRSMALIEVLGGSVIGTVYEVMLFRGVCFAIIARSNRMLAYVISAALFLLSHISVGHIALFDSIGFDAYHGVMIVVFGVISAHVYERTGSLILCICFHGDWKCLHIYRTNCRLVVFEDLWCLRFRCSKKVTHTDLHISST